MPKKLLPTKTQLFLGYMLLVGTLLGLLATKLTVFIPVPRASLFFFGVALTPIALGHWMLLATKFTPRWTWQWVTFLPLAILALTVSAQGNWQAPTFSLSFAHYLDWYAAASGSLFFFFMVKALLAISRQSNNHQDANLYLGQARRLLESRSLAGLTDFETNLWNVATAHHGVSYSGYLAFARSFAGIEPEWEKDETLKIAFQYNFVCYTLALFAFAYCVLGSLWGAVIALFLVLRVPNHRYVSQAFSREPYRQSSSLAFAGIMAGVLTSLPIEGFPVWALAILILAYLTLDAHALGAIVIVLCSGAWVGVGLITGLEEFWSTAIGCVAIGCGTLVAARKYITAYRKTGALWGNIPIRYAVKGTVLDSKVEQKGNIQRKADTRKEKFIHTMKNDGYVLSLLGCVSSIVLIPLGLFTDIPSGYIFTSFASLFLLLPMVGVFDFSHYKVSNWFACNIRYILHWYPFLSISFVALLMLATNWLEVTFPHFEPWMIAIPALHLSLTHGLRAISTWIHDIEGSHHRFQANMSVLHQLSKASPKDGSIVLSQYTYAPYMKSSPGFLYTKPYWPILQAPTAETARMMILKKKIRFFVIEDRDIKDWFIHLPFYTALNSYGECVYKGNAIEVWTCG